MERFLFEVQTGWESDHWSPVNVAEAGLVAVEALSGREMSARRFARSVMERYLLVLAADPRQEHARRPPGDAHIRVKVWEAGPDTDGSGSRGEPDAVYLLDGRTVRSALDHLAGARCSRSLAA
ncbi:hypothetical protein [Actinocorallia longicatena]|uniref:Uncharacterized protein n=1 Tax=Actinocorallia longicatena TaxID=111803 RepID=A0ABP6QEP1_9ACTN